MGLALLHSEHLLQEVDVRRNKSPSKFCVHCKMCFDVEVYDENTLASLLFKQPYYLDYRKCITMNGDICFVYTH